MRFRSLLSSLHSPASDSSPQTRGTRVKSTLGHGLRRFSPAGAGNTRPASHFHESLTVHPRGCGEHFLRPATPVNVCGSSPRVRGTPRTPVRRVGAERFIPAGAGNTGRMRIAMFRPPVHPRGCGEHTCSRNAFSALPGSSPRVRGTLGRGGSRDPPLGFIPAGAGNTLWRSSGPGTRAVHPRGCGEHWRPSSGTMCAHGSSPRVRGTPRLNLFTLEATRFIPAGAGNTRVGARWSPGSAVHPRGCGEHKVEDFLDWLFDRFIPAGAGNTALSLRLVRVRAVHPRGCGEHDVAGGCHGVAPVHPRGCGEHLKINFPRSGVFGSSPRVRGTRHRQPGHRQFARFIPAGAGNTAPDSPASLLCPVHPRGCGEHSECDPSCPPGCGSSPRVRGTPPCKPRLIMQYRFIPAGAGNTGVP